MRLVATFLVLIQFAASAPARADTIGFTIDIDIGGFDVFSNGYAEHVKDVFSFNHGMSGEHVLNDGAAGTIAVKRFADSDTTFMQKYEDTVHAGTIYGHCYRAYLSASCPSYSNGVGSHEVCAPSQNPPPDPITLCDDGSYSGTCSPIILNLGIGGYTLSGPDDPVHFDIDANGTRDSITWTSRQTPQAFLAMDRNSNTLIDDGSELFGDATLLASGLRATNGFEALQELDTNLDGVVSTGDDGWAALLLWIDANHDGISQLDELSRIDGSFVTAIETRHHWTGRRDANGNLFRFQGIALLSSERRPIYDVFFRSAPPPE